MFTKTERARLRDDLVEAARADEDIVGAALVGSAAAGLEDAWSDIDLVLQVSDDAVTDDVISRWTRRLYDRHGAAHHLDVTAGGVLYRVFFLDSSLQVDISFWPEDQFRATEPAVKVLFGTVEHAPRSSGPDVSQVIGWAWLYALHSRSAIARERSWQATMMLDHLRDQLLVLACLRHDLNPHHGREADRLPAAFLDALRSARATTTSASELARAHDALVRMLIDEVTAQDPVLGGRLSTPLEMLARIDE